MPNVQIPKNLQTPLWESWASSVTDWIRRGVDVFGIWLLAFGNFRLGMKPCAGRCVGGNVNSYETYPHSRRGDLRHTYNVARRVCRRSHGHMEIWRRRPEWPQRRHYARAEMAGQPTLGNRRQPRRKGGDHECHVRR